MTAAAFHSELESALKACPVIAILRGISPDEVVDVGNRLYDAGIRVVEVPLNSPEPYESIQRLRHLFFGKMIVGAGTVLTVEDVEQVATAGGQIVVTPNLDECVIGRSLEQGMIPITGVASVTEAFTAIRAGSTHLKVFPANTLGAKWISAAMAVLPPEVKIFAVGGINSGNISEYIDAGCSGVGTGSNLYAPGRPLKLIAQAAKAIVSSLQSSSRSLAAASVARYGAYNCVIGESPLWCSESESVVWVDPVSRQLLSVSGQSGNVNTLNLGHSVSAIMEAGEGRYYGVAENQLLEIGHDGKTQLLGEFLLESIDSRFNDAKIDPLGRVWVGTMHKALKACKGELILIDPVSLEAKRLDTGLGVCNGLGWSPDHSTLYLVDTLSRILIAYNCDMERGTVSKSRILSDFQAIPGKPDGLCVAPDGDIWVAMWGGASVVRLNPSGQILQVIEVPVPHVSSCCIGGKDSESLFISTSTMRLSPAMMEDAPWSGSLLVSNIRSGSHLDLSA